MFEIGSTDFNVIDGFYLKYTDLMRGGNPKRVSDLAIVLVRRFAFFNLAHGQQIDSVTVSNSIHMPTGKVGNIVVLIGKDDTLLIDDKIAPMTDTILTKVTELGAQLRDSLSKHITTVTTPTEMRI